MIYEPESVPEDYDSEFLAAEFRRISNAFALQHDLDSSIIPPKPRLGMVRYFDGTRDDPGEGEGPYIYMSTGWEKMLGDGVGGGGGNCNINIGDEKTIASGSVAADIDTTDGIDYTHNVFIISGHGLSVSDTSGYVLIRALGYDGSAQGASLFGAIGNDAGAVYDSGTWNGFLIYVPENAGYDFHFQVIWSRVDRITYGPDPSDVETRWTVQGQSSTSENQPAYSSARDFFGSDIYGFRILTSNGTTSFDSGGLWQVTSFGINP